METSGYVTIAVDPFSTISVFIFPPAFDQPQGNRNWDLGN